MTPDEREKLFQERRKKYSHVLEPFPRLTDADMDRLFPQVARMIGAEQVELPQNGTDPEPDTVTLEEYMDAVRFPVTSRSHYSPHQQLRIDAFNLDQLNEGLELGEAFNDKQQAALQELKRKEPHMARLAAELRQQEKNFAEASRNPPQPG